MSESSLSFASTSSFRNSLLNRNLSPYAVTGVYTAPVGTRTYETSLSDYNVVNSPDDLISQNPFVRQLYPLNEYGPEGGYSYAITYNNPPIINSSNQGEYSPNDTALDLVNEFFIDAAYIENRYGPIGGFNDMVIIDNIQNNNKLYTPYWSPPTFVPSSYSPYQILISPDPAGDSGLLSQDSYLAKLGAQTLKKLFQDRVDADTRRNTQGILTLDTTSDPFDISLIIAGKEPLRSKNWTITVPTTPTNESPFIQSLGGAYFPVSPIAGDYFDPVLFNAGSSTQISLALNVPNLTTGGGGLPLTLNITTNPSQNFIDNTGTGQQSALFANIDYNRYRAQYTRTSQFAQTESTINQNGTLNGGYYVGSRTSEPSTITSPPLQIPVDPFGRQVQTPVYGPSELGSLYEGNIGRLNFGLAGKSSSDGGGIDGQFVWVSPKYRSDAGFKATPGGGAGSKDEEFNLISSQYSSNESTNLQFKESSILDATQRLINSADLVNGISRLKHVGNAINQVSKVFNDGYKELTKGSRVLSYRDNTTGAEAGIEYCRVFAKDTPYYTYADLQKTDGITKSGRRFDYSVLDNTYNLNIAPLKNPGSTNLQPNAKGQVVAKKYMFSIENLAWRTSSKPGFTYDDLPACERGPNGGRIMWFPPYDLSFDDSADVSFDSTTFIGRPEPIYTYKNSSRKGNISWKIIVDHPSVMNTIVQKQLKGQTNEKIDSIVDSFFAGCVKFDIYELAKKFNTIPLSELYTYQEVINNPRLTKEELGQVINEISKENVPLGGQNGGNVEPPQGIKKTTPDPAKQAFVDAYLGIGFYFDNDIPSSGDIPYNSTYDGYISKKETYKTNADSAFAEGGTFCKTNVEFCNRAKNVNEFFDSVVKTNYEKVSSGQKNFITDAFDILNNKKGTITIEMEGAASATASVDYNKKLSQRRIDSVESFLKNFNIGDANLQKFIDDKKLIIKEIASGEQAKSVVPKSADGTPGFEVNCTEDIKSTTGAITFQSQVYSVNAMACRRVIIKSIVVDVPDIVTIEQPNVETQKEVKTQEIDIVSSRPVDRVQPTVDIIKKLKDGIGKKILRNLFSECDYFEVLKEENPMVYTSIVEKIKYFNPAFHSMTPEGLNSRLTFLNQCTRPGETIPTIGPDGKPRYNDAQNTSFGAPPVLILRVGDFYNCKIIPGSISFTYDKDGQFDMNPEGIGLQPMIVSVKMGFDIIGGMGLKGPVEQLQNALSFNYYANTEIYDERATPTDESYKVVDQEIISSLTAGEEAATTKNSTPPQTNPGGSTIGEVLTNIPVPNGQDGEISYGKVMDTMVDQTVSYFNNTLNTLEKITLNYNYGILQLVDQQRLYTKGTIQYYDPIVFLITQNNTPIWGAPSKVGDALATLFKNVIDEINDDSNPIIDELLIKNFKSDSPGIKGVKQNMVEYMKKLQSEFENGITTITQEFVKFEQDYVYLIRQVNLIGDNTDGKLLNGNKPRVYNLSGTSEVTASSLESSPKPTNTAEELGNDYQKVYTSLVDYNNYLSQTSNTLTDPQYQLIGTKYDDGNFIPSDTAVFNGKISDKRFFLVISRLLSDKNKKNGFINDIIKGELLKPEYNNPLNLKNQFTLIVNKLSDRYDKELKAEEKMFKELRKDKYLKNFLTSPDEKLYPKGKTRKFTYTTIPNQNTNATQETNIKNVFSTTNTNQDTQTFDGKVSFNS